MTTSFTEFRPTEIDAMTKQIAQKSMLEMFGDPSYTQPDLWYGVKNGRDTNDHFVYGGVPKAYANVSSSSTIQKIVTTSAKEPIFDISPCEYTPTNSKQLTTIRLDPVVMPDITPDGNPDLLDITSSTRVSRMVLKGIGAVIPHTFWDFPETERNNIIRTVHEAIRVSIITTIVHFTIKTMFGDSDYYIKNTGTDPRLAYATQLRHAYSHWAIFNKSDTDMLKGISTLRQKMYSLSKSKPNRIVVPNGFKTLLAFGEEVRTYDLRGNNSEKVVREGISAFGNLDDMGVVELPQFETLRENDPVDPTTEDREIGSYFQLVDLTPEDTTNYTTESGFSTYITDATVGFGGKTKITAKQCLNNCGLFGTNGALDYSVHKRLIDNMDHYKRKFNISDNYHEDALFISHELDSVEPYKMMEYFGEMHDDDLPEYYIQKYASTCMNVFNNYLPSGLKKLNGFSQHMLELNEVNFANENNALWFAAFYISLTENFENYGKTTTCYPPRVGASGLSIKSRSGKWYWVHKVTLTATELTTESNLAENRINNTSEIISKSPDTVEGWKTFNLNTPSGTKDKTDVYTVTEIVAGVKAPDNICYEKMKPMGFGSAAGIRILHDMYRNEDRGYDKEVLKRFANIHNALESLYELWKNIFPHHILGDAVCLPEMFSDVRGDKGYHAWVHTLCLPLLQPVCIDMRSIRTNYVVSDDKRFYTEDIWNLSTPVTNQQKLECIQLLPNLKYYMMVDMKFNGAASAIENKAFRLPMLCVNASSYDVETSKKFTGIDVYNKPSYSREQSLGGRKFYAIQYLPTTPNGRAFSAGMKNQKTYYSAANVQLVNNRNASYGKHAEDVASKVKANTDRREKENIYYKIGDEIAYTKCKRVGIYHPKLANRYNQTCHKEKDPLRKMFILSLYTHEIHRDNYNAFFTQNILAPISFDLDRPRQTYRMGAAVLAENDGRAMRTFYNHKDLGMADDVLHSQYFMKCTLYIGSMITNPEKIHKMDAAICRQYLGGESAVMVEDDEDLNNFFGADICAVRAHIVVKAMGYRNTVCKDAKDFTGVWGAGSVELTRTNPTDVEKLPHRRNVMFYHVKREMVESTELHPMTNTFNTIMFPGLQSFYNEKQNFSKILLDQGPFATVCFENYIKDREFKIPVERMPGEYL